MEISENTKYKLKMFKQLLNYLINLIYILLMKKKDIHVEVLDQFTQKRNVTQNIILLKSCILDVPTIQGIYGI